jgi:hypothetical protein
MKSRGLFGDVYVAFAAMFLFAVIIVGFLVVFNVRQYSSGISKENGRVVSSGQLNPVNYFYNDDVLAYLKSPVEGCSNSGGIKLSYAGLINMFMKGNPRAYTVRVSKFENSKYEPFFNVWVQCTDEFFRNAGYKHFVYMLGWRNSPIFISDSHFVGAFGVIYEPRFFDTDEFVSVKIPIENGDVFFRVMFK